ncbi:Ribonuclease H-like superfamily [Sesbania bispinosa]|nr:Ribonuclease H-like superfamily [Sesbania bispinosa]
MKKLNKLATYSVTATGSKINKMIFEAKETTMDRLIVQVRESVDRILISHDNRRPTALIQQCPDSKWSTPPIGRYKFNIDAACTTEGSWGIGIVVRDSEGFVLAAATRHIETLNDATLAEAVGIKFAIQLALDLSFHDIIVESDCKSIIDHLSFPSNSTSYTDMVLSDCQMLRPLS